MSIHKNVDVLLLVLIAGLYRVHSIKAAIVFRPFRGVESVVEKVVSVIVFLKVVVLFVQLWIVIVKLNWKAWVVILVSADRLPAGRACGLCFKPFINAVWVEGVAADEVFEVVTLELFEADRAAV